MGGDRRRPTCRCSTCSTDARHAVAHAGAGRPARRARGGGALRAFLVDLRRAHARARPRGARRPAAASGELEPRRRPTRARPSASTRSAATCSARSAPRVVDERGDARRAAAAARPTPGCGCSCATGIAAHRARFGEAVAGGFWLPECAHAPWLDAAARAGRRPRHLRRPHRRPRPRRARAPAAAPHAGRAAARADRPRDRRARLERPRLPRARGLPRLPRAHASTTTAPWANDGAPYDPERAAAQVARGRRRLRGPRRARGSRGGGLCVCALDTELLGHWWYEGPAWLGAVLDEAERAGLALVSLDDALAEATPAEPAGRAPWQRVTTWGDAADALDLVGPAGRRPRLGARAAELRVVAAGGRRRRPRAARAARPPVQRLGLPGHAATAGPYPRERAAGHRAALDRALAGDEGDGRVRSLAPHLARAALAGAAEDVPSAEAR